MTSLRPHRPASPPPIRLNVCRALAPRISEMPGAPADFARDDTDAIVLDALGANAHNWHGAEVPSGVCVPIDGVFAREVVPGPLGPSPWNGERTTGVVDTATASAGNYLTAAPFTSVLRAKLGPLAFATRIRATAQVCQMPVGTAPATGVPTIEAPGSDAAESTPTFEGRQWHLSMLDATVRVSRAMFFAAASGSYDLDAIIQGELASALADRVLAMVAVGTGADAQQLGFSLNTDVPTHSLGANGGPFALTNATTLIKAIADLNAATDQCAWWTTTSAAKKLRETQKWTGAGMALWGDDERIVGRPAFESTSVPSTLTKGSGSALSMLVFGAWNDYGVAWWTPGTEIVIDPYRLKARAMVELTARALIGTRPIRDTSFIKVLDMVTT